MSDPVESAQSGETSPLASTSGAAAAPAPTDGTVVPASKPRARLGPTEVVNLPASDSEDDDDEYVRVEGDGEEKDPDFLSGHPEDTEELHLQHLRLKNALLEQINLQRFGKHLKRLCLRQNELNSPLPRKAFEGLEALEELDCYDNRLGPEFTDEEVQGCPNITSLDLSFNNFRQPPRLPSLKKLQILYLVQNKISHIEEGELDWAAETLTSIELGGNRLRAIENIEVLTKLEELWLGKNKIRTLENLNAFSSLRILSIQSNRLTKIEGLEGLVSLEELYLSHNGLKKLEGLEKNTKLRTLDIGNNMIEEIENISHLTELEEFWANNNQISSFRALDTQLRPLAKLETVYLEHNPLQTNDRTGYRRKVILALPQVKQVDATFVKLS